METTERDESQSDAEPRVISVSAPLAPPEAPKPAPGEVWVTLLEHSPWSANAAARTDNQPSVQVAVQPRVAPTPARDLAMRWSDLVWRPPVQRDEEAAQPSAPEPVPEVKAFEGVAIAVDSLVVPGPVVEIAQAAESLAVEPAPAPYAVVEERAEAPRSDLAALVAEAQAVAYPDHSPLVMVSPMAPPPSDLVAPSLEPEPEPESQPVVAEVAAPEPFRAEPAPAFVEAVVEEAAAEVITEVTMTIENGPVQFDTGVADEPTQIDMPEVVVAEPVMPDSPPVFEPAPEFSLADLLRQREQAAAEPAAPVKKTAAAAARRPAPVKPAVPGIAKEIPVEDLFGGLASMAGAALKGVLAVGSEAASGFSTGSRALSGGLLAGGKRLTGLFKKDCGGCQTSCDTGSKSEGNV
ncbi:MAG TPA: hypothetical protein HPP80_08755 [Rhodospirillaceae bacterium]|nr:hypothetical protein [Rhodospirillaceae bacterium]